MTVTDVNAAINLRLDLLNLPRTVDPDSEATAELVFPMLARQRELSRRLGDRLPPVDLRIERFLKAYLELGDDAQILPRRTFVLDQPGLARAMSLPAHGDSFASPLVTSYRLHNGVLHNPANDRRTTQGVFHIAEGGLPIPDDKLAVPREVFATLLTKAFEAPDDLTVLPFTGAEEEPAHCWVSILLRPLVCPAVRRFTNEKTLEVRFFAPASLISNLDFVEGVFGNGGDPYLPENDSSLDPIHWTGHTGCVVLAPHLIHLTKKELGLPHVSAATERQQRDGMCWTDPDELYNNGKAFKLCARDERGVIVTIIADNYYGYCKKEVKSHISYSANLLGSAEEEHSGGALVFPSYRLSPVWTDTITDDTHTFSEILARDPERFVLQPEGHAIDTQWCHIVLVPAGARYSLPEQSVTWTNPNGSQGRIKLRADQVYLAPSGYRVELRPTDADRKQWNLIGTHPQATGCHKPATVSGGGKSEISKSITDAFLFSSIFVNDFEADMRAVREILERDYSDRFADPAMRGEDRRSVLSPDRSDGSAIKLFTPSSQFTDEYNAWLETIPQHIKQLVFVIKHYYEAEWGDDWQSHFSVGIINGRPGNSLRLDEEKINVTTLRVGFDEDGAWRIFSLRYDYSPAVKVQTEDDITASVVAPGHVLEEKGDARSKKYVSNCEKLLFQRPDDAKHRGYDRQAEKDIAEADTFLSNFEPLTTSDAQAMLEDAVGYSKFTKPMRRLIKEAAEPVEGAPEYFVSSADARLINGARSTNPRYLQPRPDLANPALTATAATATRLYKHLSMKDPYPTPVDVVAAGRRNNPAGPGVPALCCYNPLHYMELPELFMEFTSSMTGKSPSTTGAGSEGAMTKGPFNAMPAIIDLNAAFVGFALTGYDGWLSSAGYVGPKARVDHDISLLVPEVFSRMEIDERDARNLMAEGALEKIDDFEHNGKMVLASRLGYRITNHFVLHYFGRIFMAPDVVFTEEMLRPELQDRDVFADSVNTIVATHQRVAQAYFDDGTISLACPPLRALLEIMAHGQSSEGWTLSSPEFRELFTAESVLASDWYAARLDAKQALDVHRADRSLSSLDRFMDQANNAEVVARLDLDARRAQIVKWHDRWASQTYREYLVGTLGVQPL
ncbi:MAG: hypothetical protein LBM23_07015 [Propionibacteriaceae bacterium]|jgi:hypothetical protein|nr:hypothetical protein [Propionibacteriaceae bacterium]